MRLGERLTVLECFITTFEQEPLLRIQCLFPNGTISVCKPLYPIRFTTYCSLCLGHAEEGGIEVGQIFLQEEASFHVGLWL